MNTLKYQTAVSYMARRGLHPPPTFHLARGHPEKLQQIVQKRKPSLVHAAPGAPLPAASGPPGVPVIITVAPLLDGARPQRLRQGLSTRGHSQVLALVEGSMAGGCGPDQTLRRPHHDVVAQADKYLWWRGV